MNSPFARDTTAIVMSSEAFPRWWRISSCHRYQVFVSIRYGTSPSSFVPSPYPAKPPYHADPWAPRSRRGLPRQPFFCVALSQVSGQRTGHS
jgi:hypothetical protein